ERELPAHRSHRSIVPAASDGAHHGECAREGRDTCVHGHADSFRCGATETRGTRPASTTADVCERCFADRHRLLLACDNPGRRVPTRWTKGTGADTVDTATVRYPLVQTLSNQRPLLRPARARPRHLRRTEGPRTARRSAARRAGSLATPRSDDR